MLRNPLADPALLGVSGGAALGAALALALGASLPPLLMAGGLGAVLPFIPVAAAAFAGALLAVGVVLRLGRRAQKLDLAGVLLAGVAINTLCGAAVGLLMVLAGDSTLRSISFWLFGSLAHASWGQLAPLLLGLPLALYLTRRWGTALDLYQLGDREAGHHGLPVGRLQRQALLLASLLTALAVALAGIIGFIGLLVPQGLALVLGPSYRYRLPQAALAGATLLLVADLGARLALAPTELPVGMLTALLGGPFFLWLLRRRLAGAGMDGAP
jgi:ABC-type Fe3+-siderophore transport system, permease component